ncbi:arsenate reductase [Xylophilus sp. GW821-FHT01B05]
MTTLYGIPNCDTVKKARAWLGAQGLDHHFHDFKKNGVPTAQLDHWLSTVGAATLVNRRGTTWRKLAPEAQAAADTDAGARALMLEQSSVIRRPVVEWPDGSVTVGFDAADWAQRAG